MTPTKLVHRLKLPTTNWRRRRLGFTLIEILVAIGIIAVLSSITLFSVNRAQEKGRDARRKDDLKAIATAVLSYYQDKDANPPSSGVGTEAQYSSKGAAPWIPDLTSTYIPKLPKDPIQQVAATDDTDTDGFPDAAEASMGTDPNKNCGVNAWPADFNDDQTVTGADLSAVAARSGTSTTSPGWNPRYDLNADGSITGADLSMVAARSGQACIPAAGPSPVSCDNQQYIYCYVVAADRSSFVLWAQLENTNDPQIYNKSGATCGSGLTPPIGGYLNFCIKSQL